MNVATRALTSTISGVRTVNVASASSYVQNISSESCGLSSLRKLTEEIPVTASVFCRQKTPDM